MIPFQKTLGDFDRMEIRSYVDSDWLTLKQRLGYTDGTTSITLRSEEAVRDLHYALGRYLQKLDEHRNRESSKS